ncbi:uncharacterized protein MELLADRAFT_60546 [Melampsora larici-populina 98AG31]|uniref:No apical meristem-associated C-terminal domain-containing protein n=1 Tax=Melampsora larici-populina (strain 98AG31 / pathotype 3-4-7) TaxID=747676 RepID=F4RB52_MELLP|nr:uncharacterized protein MELLADRAFT_60546 [Melampsora larici-populina 98AG31]EGG10343.1 hypothetical protein MELLADRAFT_60546 [Melampsora larici-populina 98AG31]
MTPKHSKPVSQPSENDMDNVINPHLDDNKGLIHSMNKGPTNNTANPTPFPSVHNSPKDTYNRLLSPLTSELDQIINDFASHHTSPIASHHASPIASIPSSHHSDDFHPLSDTRSPSPLPPEKKNIPSIKQAVKATKKCKACTDAIANRPMKPLAPIDDSRPRRKNPAATIIGNRDEERFSFLDRKAEAREKRESSRLDVKEARELKKDKAENSLGEKNLIWEKEKFKSKALSLQLHQTSKATMEAEKADKDIAWQREKFTLENNLLMKAEEARVETERIKIRQEVMESCHEKNMSPAAIKDYLDLMFAK